ncbi:hypothetical protein ACHAWF_013916 [Thalassiosira exigua]
MMDPPTSSSTTNSKPHNEKVVPQEHHPGTPKATNVGEPNPFQSPTALSGGKMYNAAAGFSTPMPPSSLRRSRNAAKIIKGEIHNVLTVMRSDPRYYSTGRTEGSGEKRRSRSRFDYEERQQAAAGRGRLDWRAGDGGPGTIHSHPVLQGLRDLHDRISAAEAEGDSFDPAGGSNTYSRMHATTFVAPFAAAVRSGDVDGRTTGEALSALHKFIVYGFLGGRDEDYDDYHARLFSTSSENVRESVSAVARCICHCAFEDRNSTKAATPRGVFSFWSNSEKKERDPIFVQSDSVVHDFEQRELPSFLVRPRREEKSKGKGAGGPGSGRPKPYSSLSSSDEDVVLKMLSLSVQVLRCPSGRTSLPPGDVVGIFDTCLYVAIAAGEAGRSLLRSAAADALSHCVIVVFGTRGGRPPKDRGSPAARNDFDAGDAEVPTDEDETFDSDDDWGERDPTEEIARSVPLRAAKGVAKSDSSQKEKGRASREESGSPSPALGTDGEGEGGEEEKGEGEENVPDQSLREQEEPALVAIMHRLATLADPLIHEDDTCVLALSLVNIALENDLSARYPRLLNIMQNDLCRNLLRLSTSKDLTILGLALRVIFNLFNTIKDHLKVQLEVFLTSVHLRILSFSIHVRTKERVWSSPPERRELALESLLEFCREPMLMADLYLNYDCDIQCTNLFETIVSTLAKVANPEDPDSLDAADGDRESEAKASDDDEIKSTRLNILNRLALEGVLAVIDGIARRCRLSSKFEGIQQDSQKATSDANDYLMSPPDSGNSAFLGNTLTIPGGSAASLHESEYDFCNTSSSSDAGLFGRKSAPERCDSEISETDTEWLSKARWHTSLALRERKLRKRRMAKAAAEFNERSRDKEWIEEAERLGVLPSPATPSAVASFLYSTPKLDKAKVGEYLSKGPKDRYPFHEQVLVHFAAIFDFSGLSFSSALRMFLGRFRLPGEAQCIDRLMEAFATSLYEVQLSGGASDLASDDQSLEKTMLDAPRRINSDAELSGRSGKLDPPAASEELDPVFPFKSSDAAFILSFSTIMLNTDLHNPNMKEEKRMTLEQFIRNNRGINDGEDLPVQFLTSLYNEIKTEEIQVNQDLLQAGIGGADILDGLLAAKASDVATPFFTSTHPAQHKFVQAGVHDRDMYVSISTAATDAVSAVFVESWDDVLVTKALGGLENSAYICSFFGLDQQFNEILALLLGFGLDYVGSLTALMYTEPIVKDPSVNTAEAVPQERDEQSVSDLLESQDIPQLPKSFLSTLDMGQEAGNQGLHFDMSEMAGSAAHRGLLSLQSALTLCKRHFGFVGDAWPVLLDVMFALKDANALPPLLSDLDDFADSRGNPLPSSAFTNNSKSRVNEYMKSIAPLDKPNNSGGILSFLGLRQPSLHAEGNDDGRTLCPLSATLQKVARSAQLDKIIAKTNDVPLAKRILLAMLTSMFPDGDDSEMTSDPLFEHNSVFVLELAARLLIANRAHAAELYPFFLTKFQQILSPQARDTDLTAQCPYIVERIVVTILRACIHFFDVPETCLRDQLNRSLNLIITLPSTLTLEISDRIGCGAAIILRRCV